MVPRKASLRTLTLASVLCCLFVLGQPTVIQAGCGCDKPPPAPAAVIPNVAFPGMPITLFDSRLEKEQMWQVVFQSSSITDTVSEANLTTVTATASVVLRKDFTDSANTYTPQLVVTVPLDLPPGPTSIQAYTANASLSVPEESFTVVGNPVMVSEETAHYEVANYTTAVGYDGSLYISFGGLDGVCKAMDFSGFITYPLRFENGPFVIFNYQGYLIDSLSANPQRFLIKPQKSTNTSDFLGYHRHSFETYCKDHLPGGPKEVDPADPNWHLDGTPHVDYSTLIVAVAGQLDDGSGPQAGKVTFDLSLDTLLVDTTDN